MKLTNMILAAGTVAAFSLATSVASRAAQLTFDDDGDGGGTVSYAGEAGDPLLGIDIIFRTVNGPSGQFAIDGGLLNFTTGPILTEPVGGPYTFGAGGSFVLTGAVPAAGILDPDTILVTGSFTGVPSVTGLGGGNGIFVGIGIDTKHPDLLAFFDITDTSFEFANTEIAFAADGVAPNGGFSAVVEISDLTNRSVVPEGGSAIALLGMALLGLEGARRLLARKASPDAVCSAIV